MAQTGYTPIFIYSSTTAAAAPTAGNLINGTLGSELAVNITDGKLFYKDNANSVQVLAWKITPTTAGGTGLTSYTAGDLVYYSTGTTLSKLGIGTAYYQLGVNAGATAPVYQPSATSVLTAQGDLLYASAANTLARLAKNTTATRYLANTGSSNNPAWAQIDVSNGITGTVPVGNGGTGQTAWTANGILYASGTSTLANGTALTFDGTNLGVGVTPNAGWGSNARVIQMAGTGSIFGQTNANIVSIMENAYWDNAAFRYITTDVYGAVKYTQYQGSHFWQNAGSGTAGGTMTLVNQMTLDASSNLTLNVGNLVQGTAAKGVNFTANTPAAGMTSQLLNWYEEGTWTPIDSSGASLAFTSVTGIYTRVGRLVTCTFGLTFPATVNAAGVTIGGLPFTSLSSGTPNPSGGSITYTGAAVSAAGFATGAGGTTVSLYGASGTALTNATFSGFILRGQFTYTVN